ncbi:MAG TPA: tetratricopeptide repeat protein [Sphingobium sp.]|nr:tetratricopeptide repeat protein [Sphingobium sp.]
MALSPYETDALLREVDEAVRQDDMASFWLKYGRVVLVAIVLGLAAFGGWLYWQEHRISTAHENSEQFATLLKSAGGGTLDQQLYDQIAKDGGPAYRTEAALVKAALAAGKNETKAAIADYDAILNDADALPPMKEAALIRKTTLAFDTMKPAEVISTLQPLVVPDGPWFGSAGELTALAHLKMGQRAEATKLFEAIGKATQVPETLRLRAGQMASALGAAPASPATGAPPPAK